MCLNAYLSILKYVRETRPHRRRMGMEVSLAYAIPAIDDVGLQMGVINKISVLTNSPVYLVPDMLIKIEIWPTSWPIKGPDVVILH